MNLSELEIMVRKRIGNPSLTDVPNANLDTHINNAYQEIFDKYKFKRRRGRARFTTIVGQDKYTVNTLTDIIFKAWDRTNGVPLEFIGKTKLAEMDYDASPNNLVQNGKPAKWAFIETYFQVLPPPDGAYCIEFVYRVILSLLSQPSDTPIIPLSWHRGIGILASSIYYGDEGTDITKSEFHQRAFDKWVADKPVEEHEQTEAIDSGVEVPTLKQSGTDIRRPDGIFWDMIP